MKTIKKIDVKRIVPPTRKRVAAYAVKDLLVCPKNSSQKFLFIANFRFKKVCFF